MKKTLVALAAATAVSAFAQSTVTLSGNMDVAGASLTGTQAGQKGTTFSTTLGVSSTSVINLIAVEDIGGGKKITAKYGLDPRSLTNDSLVVTNNVNSTIATGVGNTTTGLARDEAFIGIEGGFGSLKLGAPNSIGLDAHSTSSPLGTGIGGGYGAAAGIMMQAAVTTRYNRAVRFDSNVMNGFKVSVQMAPGNDEAIVYTASGSGIAVARAMPNARKATEIGVNYANGPLNVQFVNIALAAQTNQLGWYVLGSQNTAAALSTVASKQNVLGANYNLGSTTLYYGYNNGDSNASTTSLTKLSGQRVAVKQNLGQFDLTAQYTAQKSTTSANVETQAKVTGFRADYLLSKTSKAYLGYENWDTGAAATDYSTTVGNRKITSVGLQKSF